MGEKVIAAFIACALSSNTQNALSALGTDELYTYRSHWLRLHSDQNVSQPSYVQRFVQFWLPQGLCTELGIVGVTFRCVLLPYILIAYISMIGVGWAAALIYPWFFVMLYCVTTCCINTMLIKTMIAAAPRVVYEPALEQRELEQREKDLILLQLLAGPCDWGDKRHESDEEIRNVAAGFELVGLGYDQQAEVFEKLGMPKIGLYNYLPWFTYWNWFVPCAVTVICRLVAGQGYWASLSSTVLERHLLSYLSYSMSKLEAAASAFQLLL